MPTRPTLNGKRILKGGNTTLFRLRKGKHIKRKDVLGGGIFSSIIKGISRQTPKLLKTGKVAGKAVLSIAKKELKKNRDYYEM